FMQALLNLKSSSRRRSGGSVSFGPVGSALAQADPVSLRQPVERAAVNAEELRRELLVPTRLAQYPADVTRHDAAQAQRRSGRIGCGHRLDVISSFPVPVSPWMSTVLRVPATRATTSST